MEIPLIGKFENSIYSTFSYSLPNEIKAGNPGLCYIYFSLLHSLDYELFEERVFHHVFSLSSTNGSHNGSPYKILHFLAVTLKLKRNR